MADFALQFDGSQNYLSLGTMGNFGSNLGNGFYCKFDIKWSGGSSSAVSFGMSSSSFPLKMQIRFHFNQTATNNFKPGHLYIKIADKSGNTLSGSVANSSFSDGSVHTLIYSANFVGQTISISVDGTPLTVTYETQQTLSNFVNFTENFTVAAMNGDSNTPSSSFLNAIIDNFQLGTSSSVLYGNYNMNEGTGTTTADSSGNGNTGTLEGSPLPLWVTGLNAYGNVIGYFTFSGNLPFNSQ